MLKCANSHMYTDGIVKSSHPSDVIMQLKQEHEISPKLPFPVVFSAFGLFVALRHSRCFYSHYCDGG